MIIQKIRKVNKIANYEKLKKPECLNIGNLDLLIDYLNRKNKRTLKNLLSRYILLQNKYGKIYIKNKNLSKDIDVSSRQIIRLTEELKNIGFVIKIECFDQSKKSIMNPLGQLPNIITLHPLFKERWFLEKIKDILPAAKNFLFSLSLLISVSTLKSGDFYEKKEKNKFSHSLSDSIHVTHKFNLLNTNKLIRVREEKELVFNQKNMQKQKIYPEITATLQELSKDMHLSIAGTVSLSAFEDKILKQARLMMSKYRKDILKPYGLFVKLCRIVAHSWRMPINYRNAYELAKYCNVDLANDSSVLEKGMEPIKRTSTGKVNSYRPRVTQPRAPASFSLHELKSKNPQMIILDSEYVSPGTYRIRHHYDDAYRSTTAEEREKWSRRMKDAVSSFNPFWANLLPSAPLMFKGDPNNPSHKLYHSDSQGILHGKDSAGQSCAMCKKPSGYTYV